MSAIEWTEKTWNPVTGCSKVSAGCKNCYAEVMARRLKAMGAVLERKTGQKNGYENGFEVTCHPERVGQPLTRRTPTMYFVNSMSDLFHPKVPFGFIDKVMETIDKTPQHTYQILTKRPKIMRQYFQTREAPDNAWLGVSVENKKSGLPRIDELRKINAKIRFLSIEPLLEDLGEIKLKNIDWVIIGGESGVGARPMESKWVGNIKKQCRAAGVKFFFKQWGAYGKDGVKRSKKSNGREFHGRTWDEMPRNSDLQAKSLSMV